MSTTEIVDEFTVMCWSIIDKQEHATPSCEDFLKKFHEFSLSFALRKRIDEASLTSRAKHVRAHIFVIDEYDGLAATSCPTARYDWNQSEGCFILCCDDKLSLLVLVHQSARFFLNAAIVAASARR